MTGLPISLVFRLARPFSGCTSGRVRDVIKLPALAAQLAAPTWQAGHDCGVPTVRTDHVKGHSALVNGAFWAKKPIGSASPGSYAPAAGRGFGCDPEPDIAGARSVECAAPTNHTVCRPNL